MYRGLDEEGGDFTYTPNEFHRDDQFVGRILLVMILACTKLSLAYFLNQISSFEEDSIAFLATLLTIIGTVHWAPLSVARSALEGILPDGSPVFMGDPCGPCFTNFVDVVDIYNFIIFFFDLLSNAAMATWAFAIWYTAGSLFDAVWNIMHYFSLSNSPIQNSLLRDLNTCSGIMLNSVALITCHAIFFYLGDILQKFDVLFDAELGQMQPDKLSSLETKRHFIEGK
ncbi:hypothetical protein MMC12_004871 [Toensbergia leucococca]|nr:hypothetical protein [Toensbergia leucococca]